MRGPGATAVGSLPHRDPVEAAELVLRALPDLPAAPQLPNRAPGELMVAQAADGLSGVTVAADATLAVDGDALAIGDVESFGDDCWDGLLTFLRMAKDHAGPIKLQLTGPVTLAVALERGGARLSRAMDVATETVRRRAAALAGLVSADVVVCLDEPWIAGAHPAVATDEILATAVEGVSRHAVAGVHCCGLADWDVVLERLPARSFASLPLDAAPQQSIADFIERGGTVAWGAVPTQPPYVTDADELWERLRAVLRAVVQNGCPEDDVRARSWVTPECGLAGLTESLAEDVLAAAARLAVMLGDRDL